jgi:catechol 2,3-dioxygenase-like lactoylglutathione lyase family enzyme
VQLNHTIVGATDRVAAATFLADILGLGTPVPFGPFHGVEMANGVTLDFMNADEVAPQHYAFLISEDEFDEIFERIEVRGVPYQADPFGRRPQQINHDDGGRGLYFEGPDGHLYEIITRPYGSGD